MYIYIGRMRWNFFIITLMKYARRVMIPVKADQKNTNSLRGSYLDNTRHDSPRMTCSNLGLEGFLARDGEKRGGLIKSTAVFRCQTFNNVGQSVKFLIERCIAIITIFFSEKSTFFKIIVLFSYSVLNCLSYNKI